MSNAAADFKKSLTPDLSPEEIKQVNKILARKHKAEIEVGRDGIKISEVKRTTIYPIS